MPYAIWNKIELIPEEQFKAIRDYAENSNDFILVASGANTKSRYAYSVARDLRQRGIDIPQDNVLRNTRLAVAAITSRICTAATKDKPA